MRIKSGQTYFDTYVDTDFAWTPRLVVPAVSAHVANSRLSHARVITMACAIAVVTSENHNYNVIT